MKPEDWARLKDKFESFLELDGEDLNKAIAEECEGNSALADELRELLVAHKASEGFLSDPAIVPLNAVKAEPLFRAGELVAGRFRILRFIAQGGIGQVYEAEDLVLEERVAMKAISPQTGKESPWALLKQEIQSARRVTHPNVCRIHDVVEHGGLMLMTMELLAGPTLSQYLKEHGPMPRREALRLVRQMAAGLQSAHDSGVIHRDFKPGNVMLTQGPDGFSAKITDFGLASPIHIVPNRPPLRAGTPGYMAPEQAAGGRITPATDVYALGAVIREMAGAKESAQSGASPPPSTQSQRRSNGLSKLGSWRPVVERCLAANPARRYQRPADVAAALDRIRRRTRRALLGAAVVFAILLISIVFYRQESALAPGPGAVIRWVADATDVFIADVSPDGRWLAARDLTGNLLLLDLRSSNLHSITLRTVSGGVVGAPVFSRDSRMIAYCFTVARDHLELRLVDIDGRNDRLLADFPFPIMAQPETWSPDGSQILIWVGEPGQRDRLAMLSTAAGSFTTVVEDATSLGHPIISPDGTEVWCDNAGRLRKKKSSSIFAIKFSDQSRRTFIDDGYDNSLVGLSSDGKSLIFLSSRAGQNGLWTLPLANGVPGGPPEMAEADIGGLQTIGLTRAGALYYTQRMLTDGVFLAALDAAAGKITAIRPAAPRLAQLEWNPKWSGNGRLCFDATSLDGTVFRTQPYVLEPDGRLHGVSPELDSYSHLQWRTRDDLAGFGIRKGRREYYDVNADTGKAELLIPSEVLPAVRGDGVWSKDADTWYNWESDTSALFRYDVHTGKRRVLWVPGPDAEVYADSLALSPDVETLAFISTQPDSKQCSLAVLSTRGGEPRALWTLRKPSPPAGDSVAWLPDSRNLIVGLSGDPGGLWRIPTDGAPPAKIESSPLRDLSGLSVHPDGKTIAFHASFQDKTELKVIENFLPRR